LIVYPNAKINIGLKVLGKRRDGFHNIETLMYPVPWCDALEIIEDTHAGSKGVKLSTTGLLIPGDPEKNLCLKAYDILKKDFRLPPVLMHLHKEIPMGAGLGGGSSDGAFALKAMSRLFDLKLSPSSLKKYAEELGSDCPFFIEDEPAFVYGRGEKQKKIELSLSGYHLIIIHPGKHISTKDAYMNIMRGNSKKEISTIKRSGMASWHRQVENDFENYAFSIYPEIEKIKRSFYDAGAVYASMSGSGSAVYGLFQKKINLRAGWKKYTVYQATL
jgi:4-diphosphocytidyl-2-C-methyl-D-erythritol kinase